MVVYFLHRPFKPINFQAFCDTFVVHIIISPHQVKKNYGKIDVTKTYMIWSLLP